MSKFYAVRIGRIPGLYLSWNDCEKQVNGFKGAVYKSYKTKAEAENFINGKENNSEVKSVKTVTRKRKLLTEESKSVVSKRLCTDEEKSMQLINRKQLSDKYPELNYDPEEPDRVIVYTDGSCKVIKSGGKIAGYGVYWALNSSFNVAEKYIGEQTNNRAEVAAVIRAVEDAHKYGIRKLLVRTDSDFTIKCMTEWVRAWKCKERPWTVAGGGDVKCRDVLERLDDLLASTGVDVKWCHVAAHRGERGNTAADRLANEGADKWLREDRGP